MRTSCIPTSARSNNIVKVVAWQRGFCGKRIVFSVIVGKGVGVPQLGVLFFLPSTDCKHDGAYNEQSCITPYTTSIYSYVNKSSQVTRISYTYQE